MIECADKCLSNKFHVVFMRKVKFVAETFVCTLNHVSHCSLVLDPAPAKEIPDSDHPVSNMNGLVGIGAVPLQQSPSADGSDSNGLRGVLVQIKFIIERRLCLEVKTCGIGLLWW